MNPAIQGQLNHCVRSGQVFEAPGSLTIDQEDIEVLPKMKVAGNLKLTNLFRLVEIGGLEVQGDLIMDCVDLLECLPVGTRVGGTATFAFNTLLKDLGDLTCKHLVVDSCTSITILELGFEEARSIHVKHCQNLEIVTQKKITWIPSDVTIQDCGIRAIPAGLKVGTNLRVTGCDNLETVGAGTFVGGDLDLTFSPSLKHFGPKVFVGGNLILKATALETLAEDIMVEGHIEVEASPISNLKQIAKDTKIKWRGRDIGQIGAYPIEKQWADEILKIESRQERERAIRRLGADTFLRAAGERFSRHKLDPDAAIRAVQAGRGGSDLYYISKGQGEWAYDPRGGNRERLPKWNETAILMVPGLKEIMDSRQIGWGNN